MNAKPSFAEPHPARTVAAASLAAVIALGILWSVITLFHSRGEPLQRLRAAERACAQYAYPSEQKTCMKRWFAKTQTTTVAHR